MSTPRALSWLRRRFVTGFFVAVPLIISVVTLIWTFNVIDNLTGPVYARLLGREVPGLGLATTALFVLAVGIVASNVLGKRLLQRAERLLLRVPVFRTVYSPVRQLLAAFSPENEAGLKRVVLVHDACGGFRLGFETRDFVVEIEGRRRRVVAVYVPTNHLYMGDIFLYEREQVVFPEITVEEGVRIFLTGGMALADLVSARPATGAGRPLAGRG